MADSSHACDEVVVLNQKFAFEFTFRFTAKTSKPVRIFAACCLVYRNGFCLMIWPWDAYQAGVV